MPQTPTPGSKRRQLTLAQLAAYDDILTDALVDHVYYWTTIPKNKPSYHPSRGVKEGEISKIIQTHIVLNKDLDTAEEKLLATDGLKRFYNSLKTSKEKDDFRGHLQRYMSIYLPDCPFEVNTTNRYTIVTHEASIAARRFIKPNETINHLSGIQVVITPEEEAEMALRRKDFSIVVSSRNKCASLFMGPARFANHDCDANARLVTKGQAAIEIVACKPIDIGEEITVTYGENYFGEDNCECLCYSCEENITNGWKNEDDSIAVKKSIEEDLVAAAQGYSLRRRTREGGGGAASRTPSVTPDIRPRVPKRSKSQRMLGDRASTVASTGPEQLNTTNLHPKRKRDMPATPPVTPAKKQKTAYYGVAPIAHRSASSCSSSDAEFMRSPVSFEVGQGDAILTDVTSPGEESPGPVIHSPKPTPIQRSIQVLKQEDAADEIVIQEVPAAATPSGTPNEETSAPSSSTSRLYAQDSASTPTTRLSPPIPSLGALSGSEGSAHGQPATPLSKTFLAAADALLTPSSTTEPAEIPTASNTPIPVKRGRGRPRKHTAPVETSPQLLGQAVKPNGNNRTPPSSPSPPPRQRQRVPGDYTLTPLLLSEPDTAWIHCTNCNSAFVQQNAYFTKSNCQRCERHSKMYGYIWPKTESLGRGDDEERVLDHRLIHRYLGAEEEAKVRGRTYWKDKLNSEAEIGDATAALEDEDEDADAGLRRSGRVRKVSARGALA